MSKLQGIVRKEAINSGDRSAFYQGMVFSYGQFIALLDMFEKKEDIKTAFLKMAEELEIPVNE